MNLRLLALLGLMVLVAFQDTQGCHRKRKKRAAGKKSVKEFFPACMRRALSGTKGYKKRNWQGAVSFALFHSQWYELVDRLCIGMDHTVECWANQLTNFISGNSPALRVAQRCVKAYYDQFFSTVSRTPHYRAGNAIVDSGTCPVVNETEYKSEFLASVEHYGEENSEDESISDLGDVVEFAKNDMICVTCSCANLDTEGDDADYDFEDGKSCGSCWTTRLATAVRSSSRLRRPAGRVARRKGGLRRRPRMGRGGKRGGRPGRGRGKWYTPGDSKPAPIPSGGGQWYTIGDSPAPPSSGSIGQIPSAHGSNSMSKPPRPHSGPSGQGHGQAPPLPRPGRR